MLAIVLTVFAMLIRMLLARWVETPTLIVFTIPIILSAFWGGLVSGLVAALLSAVAAAYFVLPPLYSFEIVSTTYRIQLGLLLVCGSLISVICERFHREQDRVESLLAERLRNQAGLAQLAAIVQHSDDAIIGKTLEGIVTSWNAGAEQVFGYTAQEMIGQSILKLIPPERQGEEAEILGRIRQGDSVRHLDTVRMRKDGSKIDVSITSSAIKDTAGNTIGASKVARVITERKQAETALRASEQRIRLATEATGVGIWEWNILTGQILWDAQMFRLYGAPATSDGVVLYQIWSDAVLPDDLPTQEASMQDTILRNGMGSRAFRIKRYSDQAVRYLEAVETVRTNALGQAEWVVGTNLDITERLQMEQTVRDSEERFRNMANSISQLAWIARPDGYIFWYNQRWYEYTGTTPDQMEGWGWQSVHDKTTLPEVMTAWTEAIATGNAFEMEFPLRGADGRFRTFLTRGQPLRDSTGQVVQWFGTNTDVEVIKRAEAQAQQLNTELEQRIIRRNEQLEAANKELEAFSYSVSHDLRSPLRAVDGYSLALLEDFGPQLPAEAQRLMKVIREGAQRMGELIDDLLTFARLSRQPLRKQTVNMESMVRMTLQGLLSEQGERQTEVKIGTLPVCHGDPTVLKQVWINLLSNALKYSRNRESTIIEVGTSDHSDETIYFVRDNGTGFDMRYADKLFGVFQRLHRAEDYEGTGVGLAIVQRIVNRHGGRIWAESSEGIGSTFFFTLQSEANS